ncbi:hypothetical protein C5E45_31575 [Nocardia nova]|uniref:Type I restriction modification DNA specificity domain-containing protein n=1 Tax=Nocardia nova TaxID=37330 RepID=A0A2S6AGG4_9NOCA|nr:hypothetical protein C5E41_29910 [Nocardia nova]PPJ33838.1 hypothetical protein C5E45_31575 [Nocardia nova]
MKQSISVDALGRLEIVVPPIDEQRRIVDLLKPMDRDIDSLRQVVAAMETLRTALSDGLLEGAVAVRADG